MDESAAGLVLATTAEIEGHPVREYLAIVSGEATLPLPAGTGRVAGAPRGSARRGATIERRVSAAREEALDALALAAVALGANAVISLRVDYTTVERPEGGELLLVTASGTAVLLAQPPGSQPSPFTSRGDT